MSSTNERTTESMLKREIAIIPAWAFVVAAVLLAAIPIIFFTFVWPTESNPPALPLQILIALIPATFLALFLLLIGYVNRDAGRRGMSRTLWTVLVIIIPNAIGFILYFLFRKPIRAECPKCAAVVDPNVNYCPRCGYSFHPTCPQCKAAVRASDTFCANCGTQLHQVA